VLTRTRGGRTKTTQIRLLTTLLDPGLYPAGELAVLYQKRWLIEIAFLHLKRTVRGTGRVLRGRSAALARQEAWALLLAHNMIAALAARAAATAGLTPGEITFTAVLSLTRAAITSDTCCPHCRKRPASANAPLAGLDTAILALSPSRAGRQRTSGRTAAERRNRPANQPITPSPSSRQISRKQTLVPEAKGSALNPDEIAAAPGISRELVKMIFRVLANSGPSRRDGGG